MPPDRDPPLEAGSCNDEAHRTETSISLGGGFAYEAVGRPTAPFGELPETPEPEPEAETELQQ